MLSDEPPPKAAPKKVFVSFDFDHDQSLKHFVIGQAANSRTPFEIVNFSLNEPAPQKDWARHAEKAIANCDIVLVVLGEHTYRAQGVLKEVAIARRLGKAIFQLIGYPNRQCPAVPNAGRRRAWTHENLSEILS